MKTPALDHEKLFNEICEKLNDLGQKKARPTNLPLGPNAGLNAGINDPQERSTSELQKSLAQTIDVLRKELIRSQNLHETLEQRLVTEREKNERISLELTAVKQNSLHQQQQWQKILEDEKAVSQDAKQALETQKELGEHYLFELENERIENDKLKEQVMSLTESQEALTQKLFEQELQINNLKEKLQQQFQKYQSVEDGYVNQVETMHIREKDLNQKISLLNKRLNVARKFKQKVRSLSKNLVSQQDQQTQKLNGQILDKIHEIEARELENQRLNNLCYQIEKEKKQINEEKSRLERKNQEIENKIAAISGEKSNAEKEIQELKEKSSESKIRETEVAKAYEMHLSSLRAREVHFLQENMKLQESISSLQNQIEERDNKNRSWQNSNEDLQTKLKNYLEKIEKGAHEMTQQREVFEKNLSMKEQEIATLKKDLGSNKEKFDKKNLEANNEKQSLLKSFKETEDRKNKLEKFTQDLLNERDRENEAFDKMSQAAEDKIVELTLHIRKLSNENEQLKQQATVIPQAHVQVVAAVPATNPVENEMVEQIALLHKDLREMAQALTVLQMENEKLKKRGFALPKLAEKSFDANVGPHL